MKFPGQAGTCVGKQLCDCSLRMRLSVVPRNPTCTIARKIGSSQPKCRVQEELQPCLKYQSQAAAGSVVTEKVTLVPVSVSVSISPLHYHKAKVQTGI